MGGKKEGKKGGWRKEREREGRKGGRDEWMMGGGTDRA